MKIDPPKNYFEGDPTKYPSEKITFVKISVITYLSYNSLIIRTVMNFSKILTENVECTILKTVIYYNK